MCPHAQPTEPRDGARTAVNAPRTLPAPPAGVASRRPSLIWLWPEQTRARGGEATGGPTGTREGLAAERAGSRREAELGPGVSWDPRGRAWSGVPPPASARQAGRAPLMTSRGHPAASRPRRASDARLGRAEWPLSRSMLRAAQCPPPPSGPRQVRAAVGLVANGPPTRPRGQQTVCPLHSGSGRACWRRGAAPPARSAGFGHRHRAA